MHAEKRQRSLRLMLLLVIGLIMVTFLLLFFRIIRGTMSDMLLQSENSYLAEQVGLVDGILEGARHNVDAMALDTAYWDESVRFVRGENPDYIPNNWPANDMLQSYRFNLVVIKNRDGRDMHVDFHDYRENRRYDAPAGFSDYLAPYARQALQEYDAADDGRAEPVGVRGILFYDGIAYYVSIAPVVLPGSGEPPAGTITFGIVMDNAFFKDITHLRNTDFRVIGDSSVGSTVHMGTGGDQMAAYLPLADIDGNPVELEIHAERTVYANGRQRVLRTSTLLACAVAAFVVILYLIVSRLVLKPLEHLTLDIATMDHQDRLLPRRYSNSREFSTLSASINEMLEGLNRSQLSIRVFESVFNGMDAHIYVSDPDTDEILFINERMVRDYHMGSLEEALGRKCWQVLHLDQTERCAFCPVPRLQASPPGAAADWEHYSPITGRHYRKQDSIIDWVGGGKAHLQHAVDITANKKAEASLQKRLEQQELMAAMSQSFISTADTAALVDNALDMAGRFLGASKIVIASLNRDNRLNREFGWCNAGQGIGQLGKKAAILFEPGNVLYDAFITREESYIACPNAAERPGFEYLVNFGVKAFIIVPIYVADGFWGIITVDDCRMERDWEESDIHLVKLITGVISELIFRSQTEEQLLRMSSIANSSPQFVSYLNAEGGFEYINQGAADLTGYTKEELLAGGLRLLFAPAEYRDLLERVLPGLSEAKNRTFEVQITRKDGERRAFQVSAFTAGRDDGLGTIASDITERRAMEQDLVAAKEQAEASNRSKSEFLSRMSHEMRTPMNAIIGMTNIAKSTDELERKDYCLDKIDGASNHLLGVINDILDMSKIESGKFDLSPSDFNIERMLMKVTGVIGFRVEEKKQSFRIHVDDDVPAAIVADEQRLSQVLTNLLSNAVKFTPEGGSIAFSASKVSEEDGVCVLRFEVKDTGIGISEDQQKKLFRSFEQADGSISRRFGGTGLGLAISKTIVELMGGQIWVESRLGQGANFCFTIRARRGTAIQPNQLYPGVNWKSLRVLAVDDAPEIREYFLHVAESLGLSCDVAADGYEACQRLEENQPNPESRYNIIFVDWRMPGMDGIELTRRIKAAYGENTVIIMISAAEWSIIESEAKDAGVDRFIAKPLFASTIADCINECLGADQKGEDTSAEEDMENRFAGNRILLAEDMEINREILIALLAPTGISIDCAENGQAAYDMFRNNPDAYDMIFMDIHMPEVDGYGATRMIRALDIPQAAAIPIVAMTANVFREDVERCLAAGMNDHLGKPLDMGDVYEKLRKYLPA